MGPATPGSLPGVTVEVLREVSDEVVEAFARLVPQLSTSAAAPGAAELQQIISSPATTLLIARLQGRIAGALTLATFRVPTGVRAWVEDVIVDEAARKQGVGEELMQMALRLATDAGARTLDLTSRASREAAGRLYERVGFQLRDTRVYRHLLSAASRTA